MVKHRNSQYGKNYNLTLKPHAWGKNVYERESPITPPIS